MAEKVKEEVKEEAKVEAKVEAKDTVLIHLLPEEWDNFESVFFGVNGVGYQIKTGEDVEVPKFLAERIANVKEAKREAIKRAKAKGKR